MATKSIFKNITIKDRQLGRRLIDALEHAQTPKPDPVIIKKKVRELTRAEIRDIFADR